MRAAGFTAARIGELDQMASEDGCQPSRYMLAEWSRNDNATVGVLVKTLRKLGRTDVIPALKGRATAHETAADNARARPSKAGRSPPKGATQHPPLPHNVA